jgi:hypothetical protein
MSTSAFSEEELPVPNLEVSVSYTEVVPSSIPSEVLNMASKLAFVDFPKVIDILAIIMIESSFRQFAKNKNSNGIMQVNFGSFNIKENMTAGVKLLREYYVITETEKGAVKAYNVGIGNYLKGRLRTSSSAYFNKFKAQKAIYSQYGY